MKRAGTLHLGDETEIIRRAVEEGDERAWAQLYGLTAMCVRKDFAVPEPVRSVIVARLVAIQDALDGELPAKPRKDRREWIRDAVAPHPLGMRPVGPRRDLALHVFAKAMVDIHDRKRGKNEKPRKKGEDLEAAAKGLIKDKTGREPATNDPDPQVAEAAETNIRSSTKELRREMAGVRKAPKSRETSGKT